MSILEHARQGLAITRRTDSRIEALESLVRIDTQAAIFKHMLRGVDCRLNECGTNGWRSRAGHYTVKPMLPRAHRNRVVSADVPPSKQWE